MCIEIVITNTSKIDTIQYKQSDTVISVKENTQLY